MKYKDINKISKASYQKNKDIQDVGGYKLDKKLSTSENKVFHNAESGKTVISNRGTIATGKDWSNNVAYAVGKYGSTERMKRATKTQQKAIEKYGSVDANVGHSQGAAVARKIGKKNMTKQVVNINPASKGEREDDNVTTLKSGRDVVSALHKKNKKTDVIGAKSFNPLTEHSSAVLDRDGDKELVGFGFHHWVNL
jgi:hypothetical protein